MSPIRAHRHHMALRDGIVAPTWLVPVWREGAEPRPAIDCGPGIHSTRGRRESGSPHQAQALQRMQARQGDLPSAARGLVRQTKSPG